MTLQEFIDALNAAGWVARNDAQHENVAKLFAELCLHGLKIQFPNAQCVGHGTPCTDDTVVGKSHFAPLLARESRFDQTGGSTKNETL